MVGEANDGQVMAAPPKTQQYTVIVVSDHSQAVRKFRVRGRWIRDAGKKALYAAAPAAAERMTRLAANF